MITPRYVISPETAFLVRIYSDLLMRNNSGKTTPKEMIFATTVMLSGRVAVHFKGIDKFHAWMMISGPENYVRVWYANSSDPTNIIEDNGTLVPNHLHCFSTHFLVLANAMTSVENYVLNGILPDALMPPGHLTSLHG